MFSAFQYRAKHERTEVNSLDFVLAVISTHFSFGIWNIWPPFLRCRPIMISRGYVETYDPRKNRYLDYLVRYSNRLPTASSATGLPETLTLILFTVPWVLYTRPSHWRNASKIPARARYLQNRVEDPKKLLLEYGIRKELFSHETRVSPRHWFDRGIFVVPCRFHAQGATHWRSRAGTYRYRILR